MSVTLTLYGRSYCHLCSEMEQALAMLSNEIGFVVECVDVDADPVIEERLGDRVPVLMFGDRELCHYFLDDSAVRSLFRA